MTIGKLIQEYREAAGIKQAALAARVGITRPYLSLIESGERRPYFDLVIAIARILKIPPEKLMEVNDKNPTRLEFATNNLPVAKTCLSRTS